ncbi:MAG: outer membrane protein transport protein [Patescibacteria group bacterium]|jgi:long-chain fatty acid transport protein|nr:outer membrane protein transport protein [Patescibacteria group bacterium]
MNIKWAACLAVVVLCGQTAFGGGVIRPGASLTPRALGMSGAHNAVASDGSALYHNIAGLSQVDGSFLQISGDFISPDFEYRLPDSWGGFEEQSEDQLFTMPLVAGATRLSDRLVLGAGIYAPYGLGVKYPNNRYPGLNYRQSLLAVVNLTGGFSYELTDTLSIGVGLDLGYGQLLYHTPLHQIGGVRLDLTDLVTEGDGFGWGYRLGIRWQPDERLALALSYSSRMKIALKGHTDISLAGLNLGRDGFDADVTFPARLGLGFAWQPNNEYLVAFDVNWFDYSQTDRIDFDFGKLPTIRQRLDWDKSFSAHLGIERQLNEHLTSRMGVGWLGPAVPNDTTNPVIPDGQGFCVGLGLGYHQDNWSFDLAYLHAWVKQEIGQSFNNLSPGRYETEVDVFSAGFTLYF